MTEAKDSWACSDCGAPHGKHGKGECLNRGRGMCQGLICECEKDTGPDHGTAKDPCPHANCYHCGWGGEIPSGMVKCPTCKGAGKVKIRSSGSGRTK